MDCDTEYSAFIGGASSLYGGFYDTGGMVDDGTVFRLDPGTSKWMGGDDYSSAYPELDRLRVFRIL
ncbi:MAG: hypothetical protein QNI91_02360 [Arenicellales bacterium]|nr:hypothetical protein [Arenicellales bacterium]